MFPAPRKNPLSWLLLLALLSTPLQAVEQGALEQSVVSMPVAEGISAEEAIDALQSKAISLNMKFVAHQPLSKELQARGIDAGRLEIFQFCNPEDAYRMVRFNPLFAAYMPCRIALVEDGGGQLWLMMLDLGKLLDRMSLPEEQHAIATRINDTLLAIMEAGANGDF